jgi:predicted nucleic acid-binding protein
LAVALSQYATTEVALSAVTAAELLHGVHRAENEVRRQRRSDFSENIFSTLPVIDYTLDVARQHARLWAELQSRGEIIGPHDLIIAATCLSLGYGVLTANQREFQRVPGLVVENWLAAH